MVGPVGAAKPVGLSLGDRRSSDAGGSPSLGDPPAEGTAMARRVREIMGFGRFAIPAARI